MNHRLTHFLLMSTVAASVSLAGCQETMDARWTTTQDSAERWSLLEKTIPLELYGQLPNISNDAIVRSVPNAIPGQLPQLDAKSANRSNLSKRLILSIGENKSPTNNAYCEDQVHDQSIDRSARSAELTLTLCDGSRLVAWSSTRIDPQEKSPDYLAHKVKRLKNIALIGIAQSPSQYTPIEEPDD